MCHSFSFPAVKMSDVPPSAYEFECALCGDFKATTYAGLRRHLLSQVHNQPRVHLPDAGTAEGQSRRRAKLVSARVAAAMEGGAGGGTDGDDQAADDGTAIGDGQCDDAGTAGQPPGPPPPPPPTSAPASNTPIGGLSAPPPAGGAPPRPSQDSVPATVLNGRGTRAQLQRSVQAEIDVLMECTAESDSESSSSEDTTMPPASPTKRRRSKRSSVPASPKQPDRAFLAARVRALYERLEDWKRVEPLVTLQNQNKVGQFNTVRLRALQEFVLSVGGAGLSRAEQRRLYEFLEIWDGTKAGMSRDDTDGVPLNKTFDSPTSFTDAICADVDAAVHDAGWMKCKMSEGGQSYTGFFTPMLEAAIDLMRGTKKMRYWSGANGPAEPTTRRESPLDGDAFRLCEADVVGQYGRLAFALGFHLYSDSTQLSWSGGTLGAPPCREKVVGGTSTCGSRFWFSICRH